VLPLVVGGAAAIDAVALRRGLPRIEIVPPFADHAVDDVAMAIGENGRARGILAIFSQKIRAPAGRRLDQPRREIELSKCRLQILLEIGAQCTLTARVLAFSLIGYPSVEFPEKFSGVKMLSHLRNRIGPRRHYFSCRIHKSCVNLSISDAGGK
jgi:hypothetical protein